VTLTYGVATPLVGCSALGGILQNCSGVGGGPTFTQYRWSTPDLPFGLRAGLKLEVSVPAAGAKAEIPLKSIAALDTNQVMVTPKVKQPGILYKQTGDPLVSLDLTNSFDTFFEIRHFSYQAQTSPTSLDDLTFVDTGLSTTVSGPLDLSPAGPDG